jgi:hypothetical protein
LGLGQECTRRRGDGRSAQGAPTSSLQTSSGEAAAGPVAPADCARGGVAVTVSADGCCGQDASGCSGQASAASAMPAGAAASGELGRGGGGVSRCAVTWGLPREARRCLAAFSAALTGVVHSGGLGALGGVDAGDTAAAETGGSRAAAACCCASSSNAALRLAATGRYTGAAQLVASGAAAPLQGGSWGSNGECPAANGECTVGASCSALGRPDGDLGAPCCGATLHHTRGGEAHTAGATLCCNQHGVTGCAASEYQAVWE